MIVLDTINRLLSVSMTAAVTTTNPSFVTAYSDDNGATFIEGSSSGSLNGTTAVTIVSAPAASTRRLIKSIYITNTDTVSYTITVSYSDTGTLSKLAKVTLSPGDTWSTEGTTDSTGSIKSVVSVSPIYNIGVTFAGSLSQISTVFANASETTYITSAALTGVVPFYLSIGAVQYYTAVATGNWTPNISLSNSPTTLNTALAIGQSTTVAFLATQGTTAYFSNALQIDGVAVTPKWQGGAAPTAGNVSGIDVYTYTIVKTAASTYTVLASMTQFK